MRKIIQISNNMALCDDGSVWKYIEGTPAFNGFFRGISCGVPGEVQEIKGEEIKSYWERLPDIPQDNRDFVIDPKKVIDVEKIMYGNDESYEPGDDKYNKVT